MRDTDAAVRRSGLSRLGAATISALLALALLALAVAPPAPPSDLVGVIVREAQSTTDAAERLVERLGGVVERQLSIIDGFSADVPATAVPLLEGSDAVLTVTPNARVQLTQLLETTTELEDEVAPSEVETDDATLDTGTRTLEADAAWLDLDDPTALFVVDKLPGSIRSVTESLRAKWLYNQGAFGQGIDVAVIDSGVVPVNGLRLPGKVVHGPDLSFEGHQDEVRHLDTFGHGTHIAGIVAGLVDGVSLDPKVDRDAFRGIAPASRIVSVKVADATGATDVSQVIAAIDWVVQNRVANGLNIRVLNLSFGTDSAQPYALDPLAYAAEVAWNNGIVVVASAGNKGSSLGRLLNPAMDPHIIAVGGISTGGTRGQQDDSFPSWTQWGSSSRGPDVVAPAKSIVSLRDPGSYIDLTYPDARVGDHLFLGSGTSQAAAVTSGAVALLLSHRPSLTPDQVKGVLAATARPYKDVSPRVQGAGLVDLQQAAKFTAYTGFTGSTAPDATGTGSLDAARGTMHVTRDGATLSGEVTWNGSTWAGSTWAGSTWAGTLWEGATWSSSAWAGSTWAGSTWAGSTWAGSTWAGSTWAGSTWAGSTWAGSTWAGHLWSSAIWGE